MPTYGTIKRSYPRGVVLRGYDPNEPKTLTQAFPVKDGVVVKSGQTISLAWSATNSQYEWVLGATAPATPYIALEDSTDEDVIEAGKLPALSCAGQFEIQTPYYNATGAYIVDTPLTYDGVTGSVKAAGAGDPVVGFVTRIHGPVSLKGHNSSAVNLNVIIFSTGFKAAAPTA